MQKKIKVLFDYQIFTIQNFGGISRLFTELYKEFEKDPDIEPVLPILFSDNAYIGEIKKVWSIFPKNNSFVKKLFYYGVNRIYSTFVLIKGDFDIFQPTYYDPYFLPLLKGKPFVLFVHDMTHEIFPETVSIKDRTIEWKKKLVKRANKIVAISESTKKDILKFNNIDKEKIEVIHLATSLTMPKGEININLPERYVLFVGNRNTYKNFEVFFKSVGKQLRNEEDLYLVCAGSHNFTEKEVDMFRDFGVEDKVMHVRFNMNEELAYIYNKAICFVFPSLYEGFGIPVLEAFACNCPAVISNVSSLPEVGGDAVEYFNPEGRKSIEEAVRRVVKDKELRRKMVKKGTERLKKFGWKITSKRLFKVYEEILN